MPESTDLERDLTAMLHNRADAARRPLEHEATLAVVGRARLRRNLNSALAGTLVLALIVAVGGLLASGALRDRDRTLPAPPTQRTAPLVAVGPNGLVSVGAGGRPTRFLAKGTGTTGLGFYTPVWSPDGSRLAVIAGNAVRGMAMYVVNADGTRLRKVVDCPGRGTCGTERMAGPAWSPDGSRLALVGDGLFVVDVASRVLQRFTSDTGEEVAAAPAWSPDGQRLAYSRRADVRVVQAEASGDGAAGDVTATVNGVSDVRTLDWSPDGTQLAISAEDGIYVADVTQRGSSSPGAAGSVSAERLVAQRPGEGPGSATWSPDGRHLAYFTTPKVGGGFAAQLRVLDVPTGDDRVVHEAPCCVSNWSPPQWSPDGTQLALSLDIDGASDESGLFLVAADGSGAQRLTPDLLTEPVWRPLPTVHASR
jgi:dipeptidyl aminopeptidase/acylaminoacyl peptidase